MPYVSDSIFWVETDRVFPNPYQPRKEFDEAKLKELAESIRMYGVLQPLTVTRKEIERDDGGLTSEYELIAGERRLRASKLAGLVQVPVIIRTGEDSEREKLELAIIENIQREDLNPVDRAFAFDKLKTEFNLVNKEIAKKVGRSREYVSNTLRLLNLPEDILNALRDGKITEGHARTLLMLSDKPEEQNTVFRETLLKKLSVREVESIARKIAVDRVRKHGVIDPELIELEKKFTESLGTRVQIEKKEFGGKVVIDYFSPEDVRRMLAMVQQYKESAPAVADASAEQSAQQESPELTAENGETSDEAPVDDRSKEEREEDADLYAIKNFSL